MLTLRRYVPLDCDATVEIFLRGVREVASRDYGPAQINAWAKVEDRQAWAQHPDRQGIGAASSLLQRIEAVAKKRGLKRLFTEASLAARPFFEPRGFVVLARQSVEKRGPICGRRSGPRK
ncbi:GNAT family N-acetyltransferase [Rhizobium mesoamericanum]|uniref:GNAT family N-acetyltransferase n=1 Tax=Rhizobium mesoamericanum TaxID=1079800 RepID=UPI00056ADCC0|nr:GNAT family N-acetyltransferase [Rhizobium mesoamericanum]